MVRTEATTSVSMEANLSQLRSWPHLIDIYLTCCRVRRVVVAATSSASSRTRCSRAGCSSCIAFTRATTCVRNQATHHTGEGQSELPANRNTVRIDATIF
jgi:hypothetical protein|eukprot:COSAG01_NODE_6008_length_3908_cov_17.068839_3_plen_100_part_00